MRIGLGGAITVTATEVWLSEVRAGRAFILGGTQPAVAASFSEVQLFNPVGSGVQVLIRALTTTVNVATGVSLREFNTGLATLVSAGRNLLQGGAVSVAELRRAAPAAQDGTLAAGFDVDANISRDISQEWLYELGAGEGVLLAHDTVNAQLKAIFMWREI